jgi:hypothetical protein
MGNMFKDVHVNDTVDTMFNTTKTCHRQQTHDTESERHLPLLAQVTDETEMNMSVFER